jgi:hypothetical protein
VQGRIDAVAHGGKLVGYAEEASELWQNLIGVMHEGLEANAHGVDSEGGAPAPGMAFLLPIGFADITSLFGGRLREAGSVTRVPVSNRTGRVTRPRRTQSATPLRAQNSDAAKFEF